MFIEELELKSTIYEYQLLEIIEADHSIVLVAIEAAEEELRSYLEANNQVRFRDGRPLLDLDTILTTVGADRNALLMMHCQTIAVWYIIQLSNADIIYEQRKERYDRAVSWLKDLGNGKVNINTLPVIDNEDDNTNNTLPFRMGSRKKFNYE